MKKNTLIIFALFMAGLSIPIISILIPIIVALLLFSFLKKILPYRIILLILFLSFFLGVSASFGYYDYFTASLYGLLILSLYYLGLLSIDIQDDLKKNILFSLFTFYFSSLIFMLLSLTIAGSYFNKNGSRGLYSFWMHNDIASTMVSELLTFLIFLLPIIYFYKNIDKSLYLKKRNSVILYGISLLSIYIILYVESRTPLFIFSIIIFYYIIRTIISMKTSYYIRTIISIFISSIFLFLLYALYQTSDVQITLQFLERLSEEGVKSERFSMWEHAIIGIEENPFGGIANYNQDTWGHSSSFFHNTWLDIARYSGVIPAILFLYFLLLHILDLYKLVKSNFLSPLINDVLVIQMITFVLFLFIEPVFLNSIIYFSFIFFYLGMIMKLKLIKNI